MKPQNRPFVLPEDAKGAVSLLTEQADVTTLKPNTKVVAINRGRDVLECTFNGTHVKVPPGYFETEYAAAQHFQRHKIVPGSRHIETMGVQSFIGILGTPDERVKVDDDELCTPFTDEQLIAFGTKIEALDRTSSGAAVVPVRTNTVRASAPLIGATRGSLGLDASQQGSAAAEEAAAHILDPPAGSATRESASEAQAEGVPVRTARRR